MDINDNKARYAQFCEREGWVPIFSMPWWMDAVCGAENWDVFLIGEGKDILAALPYYLKQQDRHRSIARAPLTQNNGLLIRYPDNITPVSKQKFDERMIDRACDYIESLGIERYEQQYPYRFDFWLPFFWRYYKGTVKYTYVIENTGEYAQVYQGYNSKVKNALRKAEKEIQVTEWDDAPAFYRVNALSFERQGIRIPYSYELFSNLYQACVERHCCRILRATGKDGAIHAAAMLVWDRTAVYFLLNGADPSVRSSQANVALIDASIRLAGEMGLKFDFEGSVIRAVNHAFREYGGRPMPYFNISKDYTTK